MCDIPYSVYAGKKPLSLDGLDINEVPKKATGNTLEGSNIYSVNGRIGIGVTNPEEDLELDGNIQLDTGGVQRGRVIFYDKQNDHEHAEIDGLGEGTNGGSLVFYTKEDGGSVTPKMSIRENGDITHTGAFTNTGNIGISTGSNLTIFGGDLFCNGGTLNSSEVITGSITCSGDATMNNSRVQLGTAFGSPTGNILLYNSNDVDFTRLTNNGGVLFDSSNATNWLFRKNAAPPGANNLARIDGATGNYVPLSDGRLKFNQSPLTNCLDKVLLLEPMSYEHGRGSIENPLEGGSKYSTGFIAQSVSKIEGMEHLAEQLEDVDNPDDIEKWVYSLNYFAMIPFLVGAIKEQNKIIEELRVRVEELEKV